MQVTQSLRLADLAVNALIAEAALAPKPGLVDRYSNGAHEDMDYALLVKSALSLKQTFYDIAYHSYGQTISQSLREDIAEIGRTGEQLMLQATNGINTHKGAIWALGLMISVIASQKHTEITANELLSICGVLASYSDRFYHAAIPTKGMQMKQKYGIHGAAKEAQQGFPTIVSSLKFFTEPSTLDDTFWINQLLYFMSKVDDTCILSRSDLSQLQAIQCFSQEILSAGGYQTPIGQKLYQKLCQYCLDHRLSPGGSADLLAAVIFLQELGAIQWNS